MRQSFDVIVIGVGSMGSSACYYLAKTGCRVLGIEQYTVPNERASHTGQSRIIRKAYFEHPDYVPLLERAYTLWQELELASGQQVYHRTGLLYAGPDDHEVINGVRQAATLYQIPIEHRTHHDVQQHYPDVCIPPEDTILYEPDAGFLRPDMAIREFARLASAHGAVLHTNEKVIAWNRNADGFEVVTNVDRYHAKKLVIASGAWTSGLLPSLGTHLKVTKQTLAWLRVRRPGGLSLGQFPCWMFARREMKGVWYGFPHLPASFGEPYGCKMAYHAPGMETDPDTLPDHIESVEERAIDLCTSTYFPNAFERDKMWKTCMYTNTPDEHFIIDTLPGFDHDVVVVAGFSGHGFKFSSVIGEIVRDLTLQASSPLPLEFLSLQRFTT